MKRLARATGRFASRRSLLAGGAVLAITTAAAMLLAGLRTAPSEAAYIRFDSPRLRYAEQRLSLLAKADMQLSPDIRAGLDSGVPLQFVLEFELREPRRLWPDRSLLRLERRSILRYYELTRHYRVQSLPVSWIHAGPLSAISGTAQERRGERDPISELAPQSSSPSEDTGAAAGSNRNFRSLLDALAALGDLRGLPVAPASAILPPNTVAVLSLKLDDRALPLPLQPVWSSTWRLSSGEFSWPAVPAN